MTNPTHHPQPELLLAYASGVIDPALSLLVSAHSDMCSACAEEIHRYEMIGGALLDAAPLEPVSQGALDSVLACIDAEEAGRLPGPVGLDMQTAAQQEIARLPKPLQGIAFEALERQGWQASIPGLKTLALDDPAEPATPYKTRLLRLEPGYSTPRHTHGGMEYTLVLTGAFRDETGLYAAGDVAIGGPDITHRPVAEDGDVCISLAVTTGSLRFTGALGLIQRVLGS